MEGSLWTLLGELNFEVFEATLRGMKRKKSVGAGGFSVELLLEADASVRRAFFDVMMAEVGAKRVADDWRAVACCTRSSRNRLPTTRTWWASGGRLL